jgi:hypothetical protein
VIEDAARTVMPEDVAEEVVCAPGRPGPEGIHALYEREILPNVSELAA